MSVEGIIGGRGLVKVYDVGVHRWRTCNGKLVTYLEYSGEAPNHLPVKRRWSAKGWE